MPLNFPNSPSPGDNYTFQDRTWTWTGSAWAANVVSSGGASVTVANVAPGSASSGDLYWDEELGRLFIYYEDTDSSQWVEASPTLTPEEPTASGISTGKAIAMAIVFG